MQKIYIAVIRQSELGKRLFNETWSSRNVYFRSRKNAVDFVKSLDEYEEGDVEERTATKGEISEIATLYGFQDDYSCENFKLVNLYISESSAYCSGKFEIDDVLYHVSINFGDEPDMCVWLDKESLKKVEEPLQILDDCKLKRTLISYLYEINNDALK